MMEVLLNVVPQWKVCQFAPNAHSEALPVMADVNTRAKHWACYYQKRMNYFFLNVDNKHPPTSGLCRVILTPVLAFTNQPKMRVRSPSALKARCKRGHRHCRQGKDEGWEREMKAAERSRWRECKKGERDVDRCGRFAMVHWVLIWCSGARRWIMNLSSVFTSTTPPPNPTSMPPPPLISVFFTQPWLSEEFARAKIFVLRLLCLPPFTTQVPKFLSISVHLDNTTSVHLSRLFRGSCPTCWLHPGCLFAFFCATFFHNERKAPHA